MADQVARDVGGARRTSPAALSPFDREQEIRDRCSHDPRRMWLELNTVRYGAAAAARMHALSMTRVARDGVRSALRAARSWRTDTVGYRPEQITAMQANTQADLQQEWGYYRRQMARYGHLLRKPRRVMAIAAE